MTSWILITAIVLIAAIGIQTIERRMQSEVLFARGSDNRKRSSFRRRAIIINPVRRLIRQAEMANVEVSRRELLLLFVGIPAGLILIMLALHYAIIYIIIALVVGFFIPSIYMRMRVIRYRRRFRQEFVDDIRIGASVLEVGDGLEGAFREIVRHGTGKTTRKVFDRILDEYTATRLPLVDILDEYSYRLGDSELITFAALTRVALAMGENVASVWLNLGTRWEKLLARESAINAKNMNIVMTAYIFLGMTVFMDLFVYPRFQIGVIAKILVYVISGVGIGSFFFVRRMAKIRL